MKLFSSIVTMAIFSFTLMAANLPKITVYKSPYCGCCGQWVKHMKAAGFDVKVVLKENMDPVKARFNIPQYLQSCHTALVGNYIVEGHVPANVIKKFLAQAPKNVRGLTVPGMVVGSPGMEQGGMKMPYNVLTFDQNGRTRVYAKR